jgi:hypothetical protein
MKNLLPYFKSIFLCKYLLPIFVFIVFLTFELFFILQLNQGIFTYTLDDAYIHLSLANNIYLGHYGINISDNSSPSSSIIWPFVLSPFSNLPFFDEIPLILNIIIAIIIVLLYKNIVIKIFDGMLSKDKLMFISNVVVIILTFATNIIGLVLSGMEHLLQLLFVLLTFEGILKLEKNKDINNTFYLSIIIGPLIRYENISVTVASVIYLILVNRKKQAIISFFITFGLLLCFSEYLHLIGLNLLPNSILAKTNFSGGNIISTFSLNILNHFKSHYGRIQFPIVLFFLVLFIISIYNKKFIKYSYWIIIIIILHILCGKFGAFGRYEIYMFALCLLSGFYIFSHKLSNLLILLPKLKIMFYCFLIGILLAAPYIITSLVSPIASNDIYLEHYQLHLFLDKFYKYPIAANDIGLVSYQNKNYVLDLGGLGNQDILNMNVKNNYSNLENIISKNKIKLVLLRSIWLKHVPNNWEKICTLVLNRKPLIISNQIIIYNIDKTSNNRLIDSLKQFQKNLPIGVKLIFSKNYI